jgi:putative transposase
MGKKIESKISFQPGTEFLFQGAKLKIRKQLDLETYICEDVNGKPLRVKHDDILKASEKRKTEQPVKGSLNSYSQEEWDRAYNIYKLIEPAINNPKDGKLIAKIVAKSGKDRSTIYRWISKYNQTNQVISLIESRGKANKGIKRIDTDVEEIIKEGIETIYLKKGERKKIGKVIEYVLIQCKKLKLEAPHQNSIRNRIKEIDEAVVEAARKGKKVADQNYGENRGNYPDPGFPLGSVQIDHTPCDIILVDPVYREPIGKPWLTTALDVTTRMILGYYLSFDAPNFMAVGLCISNAVLPKEKKLKALGIDSKWRCWGFMNTVAVDNGKEFHSDSMERACEAHEIHIDWRPNKTPHYGGHIESFHKTLKEQVHSLPGTTFSNVQERDKYPSEEKAALTFDLFEKWLVTFIVDVYHQKIHSSLGKPPIQAWDEGISGKGGGQGVGYQNYPDEARVRIDFMPIFLRTIQEYGVARESINYYSDVLKKWIHRTDRTTGKAELAIKHEFRYDPRDLSSVFFYDPDLDEYFKVPYRNLSHPSISIWEVKAIKKKLRELGEPVDEERIFRALEEMNRIEEQAITEKKKIKAQRTKARKANSDRPNPSLKTSKPESNRNIFDEIDITTLKPFD